MEMRKANFDEVIASKSGQHISIYLKNDRQVRAKIHYFFEQIQAILQKHHSYDETKKLVSPLYKLLKDQKTLSNFGENLAIFKKDGYMRVLNLSRPVEDQFVLSSTFHVKPLLAMQQSEGSGTLVFCEKNHVKIFTSTGSVTFPMREFNLGHIRQELAKIDENKFSHSYFMLSKQLLSNWLEDSLSSNAIKNMGPILLYGDRSMAQFVRGCIESIDRTKTIEYKEALHPDVKQATRWCQGRIVSLLKQENVRRIQEFSKLEEGEFISYDLQEIVHNLMAGRVKRLMVAADQNVFGKIDEGTGAITFTHFQKDHEDDDILDDLCQMAIERGVRPVLAQRWQIRKQRLVKAIIAESPDRLLAPVISGLGVA